MTNFTIEETRSRPGYNNQPPTSSRCIISHLQVYILFAERIVERVAKVCSLDPWKNTGLTFPLPGGLWKRTLHVCPWNGQCGNSVPTESRIRLFVSFHRRGRSWSVFFVLFFLPLDGGPSCNGTHESRIAAALEGCKASEIFSSSSRAFISSPSAYLKTRSTLQPRCPGARGT